MRIRIGTSLYVPVRMGVAAEIESSASNKSLATEGVRQMERVVVQIQAVVFYHFSSLYEFLAICQRTGEKER